MVAIIILGRLRFGCLEPASKEGHGETDDYCYNVVNDTGIHVRDLHATILHLLGIDHERLTFKFQGLDARLSGVELARVVKEVLV